MEDYKKQLIGSTLSGAESQRASIPAGAFELQSRDHEDILWTPANTRGHTKTATERANVVDQMVVVSGSLQLSSNALFLAVACFDRYLSVTPTSPELLEPLSLTSLWVAAKYYSAAPLPVSVFANVLGEPQGKSTKHRVVSSELLDTLEAKLMSTLDIDYEVLSSNHTGSQIQNIFKELQGNTKATGPATGHLLQQQRLYCMVSYLGEVSLLEYQLLQFAPAQLAAASYALAHMLLGRTLVADLLVEVTGYTLSQLQTPLQYLCALHTTLVQALMNGKPYAVSVKYSVPALHAVAYVAPLCDTTDPRLAV